jgi:hypothetical protein
MSCTERKRLVALHLKAIAEWKDALKTDFLAGEQPKAQRAWKKALEAERAIEDHCREHDCEKSGEGLRATDLRTAGV